MLATVVPGSVIVASYSGLVAVVGALLISVVRLRDRVARMEEWIRLHEEARRLRRGN